MEIVKKNKNIIIIIAIILLLCLVFALVKINNAGDEALIIQGNIKTAEIDLNSKIAGNVERILVEEGQKVKKQDTATG